MANETRSLSNQLSLLNSKLNWTQKVSIAAFAVATIAVMIAMMYFMNQEEYQTLYSSLNIEESGTVIEKLKSLKVPYQLEDSGKTIKVPAERVDELRIQLASEGLPQSGKIGFEIFDRTNFGMTEFVEKINYKRALEGELTRTILSIREIGQARVHLVLPKESLFEERSAPAKASVVVKLNAGRRLNESTVSGIVHLVASAVEGLDPNNVTVADSSGNLLSVLQGSPDEVLTRSQLNLKSQTEKELTAKVHGILEPIVGAGKVKADTSVVLDFSRSEQTEEKYEPQSTVIRSQQKSQDQSQPGSVIATGVPGTQSNDANPAPNFIPTGRTAGSASRQSEVTNFEVSRVTRHTLEPTGDIKKISVAVIVDDTVRVEKAQDGTTSRKATPRSAEELQKIRDLVGAAIGIDASRGDMLTVENMSFDVPLDSEEAAPVTFIEKWKHVVQPGFKYVSFLILFLLAYLLLIRPMSKRVSKTIDAALTVHEQAALAAEETTPQLALATPKTVKELEAEIAASHTAALLTTGDVRKTDILKQRIVEFVQRDPENSAQLLRAWLTEKGK